MKRFRSAFITGILIVFPVIVTIEIFRWIVHTIEQAVRGTLLTTLLPFDFPGLGVVTALVLIFVTGAAAQNYLGRWIIETLDSWIRRISVVGGIYGGIKKFLQTLVGQTTDARFQGVVLVPFPGAGTYSIGFRTGAPDPKLKLPANEGWVNIFVPCTPNPTSGFYILARESELRPLALSVQDAFRIVLSLGLVTSDEKKT